MKVLNVQIRTWFDKANGNSYFAARATLMQDGQPDMVFTLPFQYGYGSHPEWSVCVKLKELLGAPKEDGRGLSMFCRENDIRLILNSEEVKKRDCKFAD